MEQLVEKEVRGMNIKNLIALICATATICSTVIVKYNALDAKIDKINVTKASDDKYNDLRLQVMEQNIKALQINLENLRNQLK